jgi:UDP-N-acetylmuramoyl-tripeptide--D-alanyl-D-alanine ligase
MELMIISFFQGLYRLYSWRMPRTLLVAYREHHSSPAKLLRWFFTTKTYRTRYNLFWHEDEPLIFLLLAFMIGLIASGVWLLYWWAWHGSAGVWAFGLALLVGYPVIIAVGFALSVWLKRILWFLLHPKKLGRVIVSRILESQVKTLRQKHDFTIVAVAGSVGKTSTKLAIAELVGQNLRVLHQAGNYNDRVTVPLVLFEQTEPSLFNVFGWLRIFGENAARVHHPFPYDVVVLELGTDGPGQMEQFAYLKPDIGVLTGVAAEHMENFKTLDAVATEELTIFEFSKRMLVNGDDIAGKYMGGREFAEYSTITNVARNYYARPERQTLEGQVLHIEFPAGSFSATVQYLGHQGAKFAVAAAAVADMLGLDERDIVKGLERLKPFAGRMQVLEGIKGATIIDDTYNASPLAVKAALDVLYAQSDAKQRIAILGGMNELGEHAHAAHTEVGEYCDADKLTMIVTIGADAERWLAPVAKRNGCEVHSFKHPADAGRFVAQHLEDGAIVLAKGSQNGVFAEEAVKQLLAHPADSARLVRQSKYWLRRKARNLR